MVVPGEPETEFDAFSIGQISQARVADGPARFAMEDDPFSETKACWVR